MICHLVGIIICFFNVLKLVIFFNKKHKHSRVLNFFFEKKKIMTISLQKKVQKKFFRSNWKKNLTQKQNKQ